ncbi:PDZ and LIM domain protein 1-like isoform X1 [Aphidius gifuensis]|uniref:PDZ and LIM domain protein 1-like isoform X1 n=1 Tax=Aphidius gifuensis TaxID=684658 RepID=UPI001CDC02A1|nr:PDZ and LIM domain protein 1-like isoform X1 [Aphidius gifuensis]
MSAREVTLVDGSPWGFRMHGGHDLHQPLRISRVNPGSKAAQQGVREGDLITSINGTKTKELTNNEAHILLQNAKDELKLGLNQDRLGSPKQRIYKSSLHEKTSIETFHKSTKTLTTSALRTTSSEAKRNGNGK